MKIKLKQFVEQYGLSKASEMLGMKKPSLHKALHLKRKVTVEVLKGGKCKAFEIKAFPNKRGLDEK